MLSYRHMKAALLHLVFDVAAALLAHIAEHLGERLTGQELADALIAKVKEWNAI